MFLGGLWHGAAWTFVLWGLYHGLLLVIANVWKQRRGARSLPPLLARGVTFLAVVLGWVLFRADGVQQAGQLYAAMAGVAGLGALPTSLAVVTAAGLSLAFLAPNVWQLAPRITPARGLVFALLLLVCTLRFTTASPFLYFQF